MVENYVIGIAKEGLLLVILLSAPAVLVSLFVGLVISLFQATTQIQDQALTFVPKLVAVMLTLALLGNWTAKHAIQFARSLIGEFHTIVDSGRR